MGERDLRGSDFGSESMIWERERVVWVRERERESQVREWFEREGFRGGRVVCEREKTKEREEGFRGFVGEERILREDVLWEVVSEIPLSRFMEEGSMEGEREEFFVMFRGDFL